jgi:hypothetical protein
VLAEAVGAVGLVAEQASRPGSVHQTGSRHDVVALPLGDFEGERQTQRIDYEVHLGRRPSARAADSL